VEDAETESESDNLHGMVDEYVEEFFWQQARGSISDAMDKAPADGAGGLPPIEVPKKRQRGRPRKIIPPSEDGADRPGRKKSAKESSKKEEAEEDPNAVKMTRVFVSADAKLTCRCGVADLTPEEMATHTSVSHTSPIGGAYACGVLGCDRKYSVLPDLYGHIRNLHGGVRWECGHPHCGRRYETRRGLSLHISSVHAHGRIMCTEATCSSSFVSQAALERHCVRKHGKSFPCRSATCTQTFLSVAARSRHESRHRAMLSEEQLAAFRQSSTILGATSTLADPLAAHSVATNQMPVTMHEMMQQLVKERMEVEREVSLGRQEAAKFGEVGPGGNGHPMMMHPLTAPPFLVPQGLSEREQRFMRLGMLLRDLDAAPAVPTATTLTPLEVVHRMQQVDPVAAEAEEKEKRRWPELAIAAAVRSGVPRAQAVATAGGRGRNRGRPRKWQGSVGTVASLDGAGQVDPATAAAVNAALGARQLTVPTEQEGAAAEVGLALAPTAVASTVVLARPTLPPSIAPHPTT
jgi:hypothetical protein